MEKPKPNQNLSPEKIVSQKGFLASSSDEASLLDKLFEDLMNLPDGEIDRLGAIMGIQYDHASGEWKPALDVGKPKLG